MTVDIRHRQRKDTTLQEGTLPLSGEIIYSDSNTIKIGDGTRTFSQLPEFSSNASIVDNNTLQNTVTNKLQVVGVKNHNTTGDITTAFDWIGTQEEYDLQDIETEHPDWICYIIDDLSGAVSGNVYTKDEVDGLLSQKANGAGNGVLTTGDQNIEGYKYFLNNNLKSKSMQIDSTQTPEQTEYLSMLMGHDKNGQRIGNLEIYHRADGSIGLGLNASVGINGTNSYSPVLSTWISQDGQSKWTEAGTHPTSITANNYEIATTKHIMDILKAIYPVGAIYIGTQNSCPMSAFFGTWSLVSSGRALWTGNGSNGNTTIAAGLPNITGQFVVDDQIAGTPSGAFYNTGTAYNYDASSSGGNGRYLAFSATNSSSVYGNSTTVQPPAYVVNVWRRTA